MMDKDTNLELRFPVTDVHCEDITVRKRLARTSPEINGIDYVEVGEDLVKVGDYFIQLHLLKAAFIEQGHIHIEEMTPEHGVLTVNQVNPLEPGKRGEEGKEVVQNFAAVYDIPVKAEDIKDGMDYKLKLWMGKDAPLPGFDPLLSEAVFSFDVDKASDRDLLSAPVCPPPALVEPDRHYLAKDYASFRQLVLDRLALIMPEWRERHVPDLGITLVELLAYVGDSLSYYQDAVATEAYLHTARQRISVRRHARLVDYRMHEGCNARALVCLTVEPGKLEIDLKDVYFVSDHGRIFPLSGVVSRDSELRETVRRERYEIFEPVEPEKEWFYHAHNQIDFYTWGKQECCLPKGATRAALRDGLPLPDEEPVQSKAEEQPGDLEQRSKEQEVEALPAPEAPEALQKQLDDLRVLKLAEGDVLLFEELNDPRTGLAEDADPTRRCAVRLTKVTPAYDLVARQAVLEIEWESADALPFPLCLSATTDNCEYKEGISVARGNVILVDHGETVEEDLEPVAPPNVQKTCDECGEAQFFPSRRYRPRLKQRPVVFREPLHLNDSAYKLLFQRSARDALPLVTVTSVDPQSKQRDEWLARYDLLSSGGDERNFVVEVDDHGVAYLRFGDDELGELPQPGAHFEARYRFGEPLAGNVGAEAITRMIMRSGYVDGVSGVRNPLAAMGGAAPEKTCEVKLRAPFAFRQRMLRAITAEDYARLAEREVPGLQNAFAILEPTPDKPGRFTVTVWFDPLANAGVTPEQIKESLYPYRRIGHDIVVQRATPVPLTVKVEVKIKEQAIWEKVKRALETALGSKGFFHPDKLTFDAGISLSKLVSAAQSVAGVAYVGSVIVEAPSIPKTETWPDTTDVGADLMTFKAGEIPELSELVVTKVEEV